MKITKVILAKINLNSQGRTVHVTAEGVANFWSWFGQSKIQKNGSPLVVYHGANQDFDTFQTGWRKAIWLADSPDHASQFTISQYLDEDQVEYYSKGNIMPVYLKMENPHYYTFDSRVDPRIEDEEIKKAIKGGHDGIVFTDLYANRKFYVVFSSRNIKSVTGNNGDFNPLKDSVTAAITRLNTKLKPIALTEEALKNFWRWFKKSKVVDRSGLPLVVYHGTSKDFKSFKDVKSLGLISFTTSNDLSNGFASRSGGRVLPCYLSLQNPFDFRIQAHVDKLMSYMNSCEEYGPSEADYNERAVKSGAWGFIEPFHLELKKMGFDGIITQNEFDKPHLQYHAFNSTQVKSAIGNNGDYNLRRKTITANT